jgi:hypothetical protein
VNADIDALAATFDLKPAAALEVARQITVHEPDASKLTALGWGWGAAIDLTRTIRYGAQAHILVARGISPRTARAICEACDVRLAEIAAAQAALNPGTKGKTLPRKRYYTSETWSGIHAF